MLIDTSTFANNAKEIEDLKIEKRVEIVKTITTEEANYEVVVQEAIIGDVCTEYHSVHYNGQLICEFEAEGEEPCGLTMHILK